MSRSGPEPTIELDGVGRAFGSVTALSDVSLTVPAGAHVAVMGGNGAGKTTLLRTIAGLSTPTEGQVRLAGIDRRRAGPGLRRMVGYVGHESMLYRDLTVGENLAFAAQLYDAPWEAVETWARRLGVDDALARPAGTLSRGNRQRASLARALIHDPPVLLLDEPFTGLDAEGAARLAALLAALHRDGRTVLLTVHEPERAAVAERVVVLAEGRVAIDAPAPPARLLRSWLAETLAWPGPEAPSAASTATDERGHP